MTSVDDLFDCHKYGTIAYKHCLRRRFDREKPSGKPPYPGPFKLLYCGRDCVQGREIAVVCRKIPARSCVACGTAIIGLPADAPCPSCEEREDEKRPRRTKLERVEKSDRIWKEKLPDPPFIPPSSGSEPRRRKEPARTEPQPETISAPAAPVARPPSDGHASAKPPVQPPAKRRCSVCHDRELRSDNATGICGRCQAKGRATLSERAPITPLPAGAPTPKCKCGCGRDLDPKRNRSGFSGYCNAARMTKLGRAGRGFAVERLTDDQLADCIAEAVRRSQAATARAERLSGIVAGIAESGR